MVGKYNIIWKAWIYCSVDFFFLSTQLDKCSSKCNRAVNALHTMQLNPGAAHVPGCSSSILRKIDVIFTVAVSAAASLVWVRKGSHTCRRGGVWIINPVLARRNTRWREGERQKYHQTRLNKATLSVFLQTGWGGICPSSVDLSRPHRVKMYVLSLLPHSGNGSQRDARKSYADILSSQMNCGGSACVCPPQQHSVD